MRSLLVIDGGRYSIKYAALPYPRTLHKPGDTVVGELTRSGFHRHSSTEGCYTPSEDVEGWLTAVSRAMAAVGVDAGEHHVGAVVIMHALTPRRVQEMVLLSCFEQFGFTAVTIGCSAGAALCAGGETSGVAADVGYSGVRITPVHQGMPIRALCASFDKVVGMAAAAPSSSSAMDKGSQCYEVPKASCVGTELPLPDGRAIAVDDDAGSRYKFERAVLCVGRYKVADSFACIYRKASLLHRDIDCWVCHGGGGRVGTIDELLADSLLRDIRASTPRHVLLKNATQAAVEGGVIWSQLSSFKNVLIDAGEYMEEGPERCVQQLMMRGW